MGSTLDDGSNVRCKCSKSAIRRRRAAHRGTASVLRKRSRAMQTSPKPKSHLAVVLGCDLTTRSSATPAGNHRILPVRKMAAQCGLNLPRRERNGRLTPIATQAEPRCAQFAPSPPEADQSRRWRRRARRRVRTSSRSGGTARLRFPALSRRRSRGPLCP